jgi:hypothetical protein
MTGSNERSQASRPGSLRAIGAFAVSPQKCSVTWVRTLPACCIIASIARLHAGSVCTQALRLG